MKGLATLIKLHKRTLDELRRQMGSLENQKSQLQLLSKTLREELDREIKLAGKNPELGRFFGDFAKRMKGRQEKIATEILSLDKQMNKLGAEISAAFSELKKYEIAEANDKRRAEEESNRKETNELDEIGGQRHQRKKDEG